MNCTCHENFDVDCPVHAANLHDPMPVPTPAKESLTEFKLKKREEELTKKVEAARRDLQTAQGELTEHNRVIREFYTARN